jgi:ABC-type multidrug transport system fused ATPase/permease subunit
VTDTTPPLENVSFRRSFRLLRAYIMPEWKRVLLLALLLFTGIGLQLWQPTILRDFIDVALAGGASGSLTRLAVIFLLAAVANQFFNAAATYLTQDIRWRTTNALRGDLAEHCLSLDMKFFNEHTPGELIARVDEDVNTLSNFFSQFVIQVFGNGLLIVGVIVVLFLQEWRIGTGFAVFVLITGLILRKVVALAVPYFRQFFIMAAELFGFIEERLAGTEDIRANGAVSYTMLMFHKTLRKQYVVEQKGFAMVMLTFTTTSGMFAIGTALGLGLGAYLFQAGIVTIGTVYLITNYSAILQQPLRMLTQQLQDMQRAVAGASRIQDLYYTQPTVHDPTIPLSLSDGALSVDFDDVFFYYHPDTPVLNGVSFSLPPNRVMGLLGRTGSGKTTITRLIFRMYDVIEGEVRLGEVPLRDLRRTEMRQKIGMVTQDVQLFAATIRENLTFFNDSISDERILDAFHRLGLWVWYETLPNGLDTELPAGGGGMSAGEAQLLAFTRVFLQDPGLIILDEASSRLDPATEALIERAVGRLLEGRSAIIIAHRLATVQRADDILILENGRVLEYGARTELRQNPESHFAALLRTGLDEVLV